ncbi:MAG: FIST C-terminal domain-containing protein [Anaerolineales bacterium]|nr:FIST C-terminal domain-containing protein [Anaerolineales bacterium]
MQLQLFNYTAEAGWSVEAFPQLDSPNTLILVFGATAWLDNPAPIQQLAKAYPQSIFLGCSTSGEIFGTTILDESLAVAAIRFTTTTIQGACVPILSSNGSFDAGQAIANQLLQPNLRGLIVLSDGTSTNVNGSNLVRGLNSILPDSIAVTGGLAGDGARFTRTWVLKDKMPHSGYVAAVGFYGENIHFGHGSKAGWRIFGPERRITRSQENVLYELDGQPALELYKRYLGEWAADLPATALLFPLSIRESHDSDKQIVRTILSVDEETQSMTFAGDVPEGYFAQLMRASFNGLVDGAAEAAAVARAYTPDIDDTLSIAISCVGRRLVMGEYTEDELDAALEVLPKGTQQIGFYSYGEISPFATGYCDLHNQTMTVTTITED